MNNNKKNRAPAKKEQKQKNLAGAIDSNTASSMQVKGLLNKLDEMKHFISDMENPPGSDVMALLGKVELFLRDPDSSPIDHEDLLHEVQSMLMSDPSHLCKKPGQADKEAADSAPQFMTIQEAAKTLGVTVYTIDGWVRRGHINTKKIGKRRLVQIDQQQKSNEVCHAH